MADGYGFEKNGVSFSFDNEDLYLYEAFKGGNISREELRKEYSRLRQVANKRLSRMKGTKYESSNTYQYNAGKYGTLEQIEKEATKHTQKMTEEARQKYVDLQTAKKMHDLYVFLTAKTGSIRGMQRAEKQMIDTFHERGLIFITKDNIGQFAKYMEHLRALHKGRQFDSERAAEVFGIATKKGINPQEIAADYEFWNKNAEELASLPKIKNVKNRTAEEYKKQLEIEE